jgi:cysteine desulfurase/selenocysteine lyase
LKSIGTNIDTIRSVLDPYKVRERFPILNQEVNGNPLIYFDNAATTQKPIEVIDAIHDYYLNYNANIHRGIHTLAEKATEAYETTRDKVKKYINAALREEIIFTYGTTDGINLVAQSLGRKILNKDDEVIISAMEHHSNIVPWQMICEERGAVLRIIPITETGELMYNEYLNLLNEKTRIVSIVHVSNSLGTINPVREIVSAAHETGALVVVDGAQAAAHIDIDVQNLECDLYAFSSHKMFGPTGVGVLYGKSNVLDSMAPYRGGGEMIKEVTFEKTTFNDLPFKFEAGTPNIADVIGFGAAIDYMNTLDKKVIADYEQELLKYGVRKLSEVPGLKLIGTSREKVSVISFIIEGLHPFEIGMMLDASGIAVRTGHHCTQPLMDFFNIEGTVRASLSIYNTRQEIDILSVKLKKILKIRNK